MSKLFHLTLLVGALLFSTAGCDVEQTRDGRLPDVDVDVSGDAGELPAYDVDLPDVDVSTEDKKVLVPKVILDEETVTVPDVDVDLPEDN